MRIGRKEIIMGLLFAIVVAIVTNYTSIEKVISSNPPPHQVNNLPPLLFSVGWYIITSLLCYLFFSAIFHFFYKDNHKILWIAITVVGAFLIVYTMGRLHPIIRDFYAPYKTLFTPQEMHRREFHHNIVRGLNIATIYKHILILILNLLFVYIQKLLYTNQRIAMRNEQLQLEAIKSQHNALLQQINPHFFFNSLNSLRYIIVKKETDKAVEYLDNLTAIFRKTLKASDNTLYTLSEEIELTNSYAHIIEKRFEGKFFVKLEIDSKYNDYLIAPLSLLTLIENVVKHNKIGIEDPIIVTIYTKPDENIVIENNIVHKFDEIEKCGIGLKNLNQQYKLLVNREIDISVGENNFKVELPLIMK